MIFWLSSFLIWAFITWYLHKNRIWIFYYIWASVGITLLLIVAVRGSVVEASVEWLTGYLLHTVLSFGGLKAQIYANAPGVVLFLLHGENSWTCINIDIECSGVLEGCVLSGLLLFYPANSVGRRIYYLINGLSALFVVNFIRLLVIVGTIDIFGRDAMFIAHTLIGRLVFFALIIIIYWYLFTRPALALVRKKVSQ